MKKGIELIAEEIERAINVEGWNDTSIKENYGHGEMAGAASCYLTEVLYRINGRKFHTHVEEVNHGNDIAYVDAFPWDAEYDKRKKHNPIRLLTIAGAWIAREIDRLNSENQTTI